MMTIFGVLGIISMITSVLFIMLSVTPMLAMMWDSPKAGYKPLVVAIPWFLIMIALLIGDVVLLFRLFS